MSDFDPQEHRFAVSRSARCYTRGGSIATEAWMLLHGYGQLASRFLRGFERVAVPTRLLVAPEGLSRFYLEAGVGKVGASWMTKEDREREIADYLAYLEQVRAELVPPVPLTVLGFSQGVTTAARWAVSTAPAPVRLICWGGLIPDEIHPRQLAGIRVTFVLGSTEAWATPKLVNAQVSALQAGGVAVDVHRFEGGHEILPAEVVRLA